MAKRAEQNESNKKYMKMRSLSRNTVWAAALCMKSKKIMKQTKKNQTSVLVAIEFYGQFEKVIKLCRAHRDTPCQTENEGNAIRQSAQSVNECAPHATRPLHQRYRGGDSDDGVKPAAGHSHRVSIVVFCWWKVGSHVHRLRYCTLLPSVIRAYVRANASQMPLYRTYKNIEYIDREARQRAVCITRYYIICRVQHRAAEGAKRVHLRNEHLLWLLFCHFSLLALFDRLYYLNIAVLMLPAMKNRRQRDFICRRMRRRCRIVWTRCHSSSVTASGMCSVRK